MRNIKRIPLLLIAAIFFNLVGCLPMSEAQIAKQAQNRYQNIIQPTPEAESKEKSGKTRNANDLADEQVLRLSGRDFYNMDPANAYNLEWVLFNQLFIGLTRQDPESQEFQPAMAKDWNQSADGLTWTFTLREGIPWVSYDAATGQVAEVKDDQGNTRMVTAADFKAGILRVVDPAMYSGNAFLLFNITGAQDYFAYAGSEDQIGIQTPSDTELVIQLSQPQAGLDALTELPIFSAFPSWASIGQTALTYFYGPYVVKEYLPGEKMTLVRNPFWPDSKELPQAVLEEIDFNLQSGQDAITAFQNGEFDGLQVYPEEYATIKENIELKDKIAISTGSCGYYLVFNNVDLAPLETPAARQAIAAAIDKEKINDTVFGGTGQALNQYAPAFLRGSKDYGGAIGIPFDPESAKAKFDELGYVGIPLTLTTPDSANYLSMANRIKEDLETNLGFSITIDSYPWSDYISQVMYNSYASGMYLRGYCLDFADAENLWDRWLDESFFVDVANGRWLNQDFFDTLNMAKGTVNLNDRVKFYQKAEEIIVNQDSVIIPLVWSSNIWLVNPKLDASFPALYPQLEDWAFVK